MSGSMPRPLSMLWLFTSAAVANAFSTQDVDAQFLMKASFGPTRKSLEEISGMTYAQWITQQVALPAGSHREFFRQHANPRFDADRDQVGPRRSPCSAGSRWEQHALTRLDTGKAISIVNYKLSVDGVYRTDIDDRKFLSRWVSLANWAGYICNVYDHESVGGEVHVSEEASCTWDKYFSMPNPAMYLKGQVPSLGDVSVDIIRPGVLVLEEDWYDCPMSEEGDANLTHHGTTYRYSGRVALLGNSFERPSLDPSICVARNILNEKHCIVSPLNSQSVPVTGLKVAVFSVSPDNRNFPSVLGLVHPVIELVEKEVNHRSMDSAFRFWPIRYDLAARWTGKLTIHTPGLYTFFLNSDDGSQLLIDSQQVVDNGGYHGMIEKEGQIDLVSGPHDILIEFYQGGGGMGIICSWSGPDSGNEKEIVPSSAFSTLPPAQGANCLVGCGSAGEVANEPKLGYQYPYQTNQADFGGADDLALDNRQAQRMQRRLTKASVWFQKALYGQDQLRQRIAWALSQIFVASESGLNSDLTEMWVNYYDLFVRNAFGNFRDILQQVTYSPVMGIFLTHVGSTSYDYDKRFPNENYAREVMQLFTIGIEELHPNGTSKIDALGNNIPTYDNRDIQNIARIFTGFENANRRYNAESASEWVDPMKIEVRKHDIHPKTGLYGNFIGDGFPLCEDSLPPRSFLRQGARWEFVGPHGAGDALELNATSPLRKQLCGGDVANCVMSAVVELPATLPCHELECTMEVTFVKIGLAVLKYVPPVCVHRWIVESTVDARTVAEAVTTTAAPIETTTEASTPCTDVQPPQGWKQNTCEKQLLNTKKCAERRAGTRNDGYCHKTCGVCSVPVAPQACDELCFKTQGQSCTESATREECAEHYTVTDSLGYRRCEWDEATVQCISGSEVFCEDMARHQCVADDDVNETIIAPSGNGLRLPVVREIGGCVKEDGSWTSSTKLDEINSDNENNATRQQECLDMCIAKGAKGCMLIWDQWNEGCHAVYSDTVGGHGGGKHYCWVLDFSDGQLGRSYMMYPYQFHPGYNGCEAGAEVQSIAECEEGIRSLGLPMGTPWFGNYDAWVPQGCAWGGKMFYQMGDGAPSWSQGNICRAHIVVNADGEVMIAKRTTKFQVKWRGAQPSAGTHTVYERTIKAFGRVPTKVEAQAQLFIGAYPPTAECVVCDGAVKVYGDVKPFTVDGTVFEIDGKFYKNAQSIVFLESGESFRNPPVFLRTVNDLDAVRSATAEVEAFLDQLFHHPNTPVFIAQRLIQRFGTSTPSGPYVQAVQQAFRDGDFEGMGFSGKYGDLAATVTAILLHPESHSEGLDGSSLREPIVKVTHMMRAMEYQDSEAELTVIRDLADVMGQFPYKQQTVFNFYMANFELPELQPETEPEPEPESTPEPETTPEPESGMEPEPEPESELALGPEFQIFTPQYFTGYLNGMSSLIQVGVGWDCDNGESLGTSAQRVSDKRWRQICPQGTLTWQSRGHSAEEVVEELNVLLTGGRLTPASKSVVLEAYTRAGHAPPLRLRAAQQAVMMTAEFNTLGSPLPLPEPRWVATERVPVATRPYKAIVMLYLDGGADTFNMLVPNECSLYDEYAAVRTDLTLQPSELQDIPTPNQGQPCEKFGLHGSFSFLKSLYDKGEAAFVSNVGNLVEPMDLHQYRSGETQRCVGQFSHSDQTHGAQTLKCQEKGASPRGAGGRIADGLAGGASQYATTSFSLAGNAIWPKGVTTDRELVDDTGARRFYQYEQWREAIVNLTAIRHGNPYSEAYTQAFLENVGATEHLARVMMGTELQTAYATNNWLQRELKQVATLIAAREGRQAERDFFFVSMGGWDHHNDMKANTARMFGEVDDALRGFVAEMEAQGIWDSVLVTTESEFARTLDSNGGGSDHAYAGNHIVVGGKVNGGRVFNRYPGSLAMGGSRDLGRGSLIPEFPWESMMAPIGEWMGLQADQLETAFPNLNNFNSSHIISQAAFFKA